MIYNISRCVGSGVGVMVLSLGICGFLVVVMIMSFFVFYFSVCKAFWVLSRWGRRVGGVGKRDSDNSDSGVEVW